MACEILALPYRGLSTEKGRQQIVIKFLPGGGWAQCVWESPGGCRHTTFHAEQVSELVAASLRQSPSSVCRLAGTPCPVLVP